MSDPSSTSDVVVLGELSAEELQQMRFFRQQANSTVYQIGLNRLEEMRLLSQYQQVEVSSQGLMQQVGARLGVPDGTRWQVTAEGKAVLVP